MTVKKINIYLDYKIDDISNYHGNSFPPLIDKYLLNNKIFNVYNLNDYKNEKLDCILVINGGSHWTYRDINARNFHRFQIIKWGYPKFKKIYLILGIIFGLENIGFYKRHLYQNKSYEKHLDNLISRNPNAKIIHRLDGIYQMIGKVYGYDKTIKKINKIADLTIYQSKYSKSSWERGVKTIFGKSIKINPKKSATINNGVDFSIFNTEGDIYKFDVKYPILNVSASPSPKKGLYKILELAECLKDNNEFHFYLIGNQIDDPLCGVDIKKFENVTYLGQIIDRKKIATYYKGAKIFIFPSEDDCSPNVILEAMACGLPVLTINSGGIPELIDIDDTKAGMYIDENNPIMSLSTIIKNYNKFSKNAKILSKTHFDFDKTANTYLKEIEKLVIGQN